MLLKQSNIWTDFDQLDYVCITTNAIVKANGNLVMGAGIALDADKHNPNLKVEFGRQIRERGLSNQFYGLLLAEEKYIAFQTKYHWRNDSPLELVARSIDMLRRLALKYPNCTFGLPFPGISNGKLNPKDVHPLLLQLPDNVTVYHLVNLELK